MELATREQSRRRHSEADTMASRHHRRDLRSSLGMQRDKEVKGMLLKR